MPDRLMGPGNTPDIAELATRLPVGFFLGTATSAYQIEGGACVDGRGRSIWDTFCAQEGRIADASSGEVAVDHYTRWREDLALMAALGMHAYRFSVAWPRVLPDGDGPVEARGLAFYRRLVDALVAEGITPVVTLYHWDLPQALQDRGGWQSRATVDAFVRYATIVQDALGDAVEVWTTINEPWCAAFLGHASGVHAPGLTDPGAAFTAAHHLLLAHGEAVAAMRSKASGDHRFGIVPNLVPVRAASDEPDDARASGMVDLLQNRSWLDALLLGRYPEELCELHRSFGVASAVRDGDLELISQPLDVLGINYYHRHRVRAAGSDTADSAFPGADGVMVPPDTPTTAMGWGIEPHGLRDLLLRLDAQWPVPPLLICENGAAFDDADVDEHGRVRDVDRIDYLAGHIAAVAEAIDAGVDVRGYLAWTLLDNFEWAYGYTRRFGLVSVDPLTLRRTPKASAHWFGDLAETLTRTERAG